MRSNRSTSVSPMSTVAIGFSIFSKRLNHIRCGRAFTATHLRRNSDAKLNRTVFSGANQVRLWIVSLSSFVPSAVLVCLRHEEEYTVMAGNEHLPVMSMVKRTDWLTNLVPKKVYIYLCIWSTEKVSPVEIEIHKCTVRLARRWIVSSPSNSNRPRGNFLSFFLPLKMLCTKNYFIES